MKMMKYISSLCLFCNKQGGRWKGVLLYFILYVYNPLLKPHRDEHDMLSNVWNVEMCVFLLLMGSSPISDCEDSHLFTCALHVLQCHAHNGETRAVIKHFCLHDISKNTAEIYSSAQKSSPERRFGLFKFNYSIKIWGKYLRFSSYLYHTHLYV